MRNRLGKKARTVSMTDQIDQNSLFFIFSNALWKKKKKGKNCVWVALVCQYDEREFNPSLCRFSCAINPGTASSCVELRSIREVIFLRDIFLQGLLPCRERTTFYAGVLQVPAQLKQERKEKDSETRFIARFYACCEIMLFCTVTVPHLYTVRRFTDIYTYSVFASSYKSRRFPTFSPFFAMKLTVFSAIISGTGGNHCSSTM
jgi:hypothetical protein